MCVAAHVQSALSKRLLNVMGLQNIFCKIRGPICKETKVQNSRYFLLNKCVPLVREEYSMLLSLILLNQEDHWLHILDH